MGKHEGLTGLLPRTPCCKNTGFFVFRVSDRLVEQSVVEPAWLFAGSRSTFDPFQTDKKRIGPL